VSAGLSPARVCRGRVSWPVPENTVHDLAITIAGGLSNTERQHVQRRVLAPMVAQALIGGKHQSGGRRTGMWWLMRGWIRNCGRRKRTHPFHAAPPRRPT
jgi:hypothetical protein